MSEFQGHRCDRCGKIEENVTDALPSWWTRVAWKDTCHRYVDLCKKCFNDFRYDFLKNVSGGDDDE